MAMSVVCRDYPEYYEVIKRPMDLQTLKQGLGSKYDSVQQVYDDSRLIWSNCQRFNAEGSEIYETANKLAILTKSLFQVR